MKPMGFVAPVLFGLALLAWLGAMISVFSWIGAPAVPGRETDKVIRQAVSGGFVLLVWIFLGGLLLYAGARGALPAGAGTFAWIAHPISLLAALAAVAVLYDPAYRLALALPAVLPVLIGGYLALVFVSPANPYLSRSGVMLWVVALFVSFSIVPPAVKFAEKYGDDGSIDATPGPALDRWMAKQQDQRRADGLKTLSRVDDETEIGEIENLTRGDSPVREEALATMRKLPHRQEETVRRLANAEGIILPLLPYLDLQPTPELCAAGKNWIRSSVNQRRRMNVANGPETFVGMEFTEGLPGIEWLAKNCDFKAELDLVEAYAKEQKQDAKEIQDFIASLQKIREQAK